jgi:hypothetical protein
VEQNMKSVFMDAAWSVANEIDGKLSSALRNSLFGSFGEDLASRNIFRGRDMDLPHYDKISTCFGVNYNQKVRRGPPPHPASHILHFLRRSQLRSASVPAAFAVPAYLAASMLERLLVRLHPCWSRPLSGCVGLGGPAFRGLRWLATQCRLHGGLSLQVYCETPDAFVGLLRENPNPRATPLGPTHRAMFAEQFHRIFFGPGGDWWENRLATVAGFEDEIRSTTIGKVIRSNTQATFIPKNAFSLKTRSVSRDAFRARPTLPAWHVLLRMQQAHLLAGCHFPPAHKRHERCGTPSREECTCTILMHAMRAAMLMSQPRNLLMRQDSDCTCMQ